MAANGVEFSVLGVTSDQNPCYAARLQEHTGVVGTLSEPIGGFHSASSGMLERRQKLFIPKSRLPLAPRGDETLLEALVLLGHFGGPSQNPGKADLY